jgi:hypothetical protein
MLGEMVASTGPILSNDMRVMGRAIADDAFDQADSTVKTIAGELRRLAELAGTVEFAQLAASLFARPGSGPGRQAAQCDHQGDKGSS